MDKSGAGSCLQSVEEDGGQAIFASFKCKAGNGIYVYIQYGGFWPFFPALSKGEGRRLAERKKVRGIPPSRWDDRA